jgi:hypothetical protein
MSNVISTPLPIPGDVMAVPMPARFAVNNNWIKAGIFFAAHAPLAILMFNSELVATVHALLTVVIGAVWILSKRHMERAAYVCAYVTGAEVLWRMCDARVLWEYGKYSVAALFIVALLRTGQIKWMKLPLLYFLLLIPSALLTIQAVNPEYARKSLSFNLSGPFALMVCVWFFSNLRISMGQLQRLFLALIGPVIGIASVTAFTTFSAMAIKFSSQSNKMTSGGYGPNQVSAILGFGVLLAVLFLLDSKTGLALKVLMFGAMILLGVQSAMTFSRGGLYMAAGGALLGALYLIRDANSRIRMVLVITALFVVTNYILLPYLDTFTGGSLSSRFQEMDATGRDEIIMIDLQMWKENPIFGVGPGMGLLYRYSVLKYVASHTEYTRLLAEHGAFGLLALVLLVVMVIQSIRRARTIQGKALAAAMVTWAVLFMMIDGMRLVTPAFAFGLSFAAILPMSRPFRSKPFRRPWRRGLPKGGHPSQPRPKSRFESEVGRDDETCLEGETGGGR